MEDVLAHVGEDRPRTLEGGGIAAQRDVLKQRLETLRETIRRYERIIAEQANALLPFAIVPQIAQMLKRFKQAIIVALVQTN